MDLPMKLDQYIDCFWTNEAPYFIPALLTNPQDEIVNYTYWNDPDDFDRQVFGEGVIATRKLEQKHHVTRRTKIYTPTNSV